MNERIQALYKQAEILITEVGAFHNTPYGAYQLQEQHLKKFAELIVQECATIADCNSPMSYPDHGIKIKRHFGVDQ